MRLFSLHCLAILRVGVSAASLLVAAACCGANPPVVLDQEHFPTDFSDSGAGLVDIDWDYAQTFIVGKSGTLRSIQLLVHRHEHVTLPLNIDLRTTDAGKPSEPDAGANVLASLSVEASEVPVWTKPPTLLPLTLDLSPFNVAVTPGQVLAIVLQTDDPGGVIRGTAYNWYGVSSHEYPGGEFSDRASGNSWTSWPNSGYDLSFRTFVAVPEPLTSAIAAISALSLTLARRRSCPLPAPA